MSKINKNISFLFFSIIIVVLFNACYYDKADIVYPFSASTLCDTAQITYASHVAILLQTNCNNCHGASTANSIGGGINLSTYSNVQPYISNGSLMNSILQNGKAAPMPKNAYKLNTCSIATIQAWINKGALNN